MIRYVAFLRGINVSGQKLIKMEALRQYFELPGFKNIVTYIQSGNVLFDSKETDADKLVVKIEKQLAKQLGYEVPVVIRSLDEIKDVIRKNPFQKEMEERKLYVHFLSGAPDKALHSSLEAYKSAGEDYKIIGKEMYFLAPGMGNSKLTNTLIERKLGVTTTARNWATINKVLTL
ncbi:MAG: hypothetical protein K0Q79_416 [Flavipsychrobacter sp.]|jgi:uncharacterized protein (DUF1697 family)|nr:hypothetical protein [Flavipsychrobacter sp.]